MSALIDKVRAPYQTKLAERLATADDLLYRRGNFNGTWDQVICDALMAEKGAEIAFSPGFRWGTTLLPGEAITMEHLLDQTAITYPYTTVNALSGETIKTILEDVADNLFNPDPYYQQGGDMVRVGGLRYAIDPTAPQGKRITRMELFDGRKHRGGEDVQGRGLGAGRARKHEPRAASRFGRRSRGTCARGRSSSRASSICPSCTASRAIRESR